MNREVLGINERNIHLVYALNPRKHFPLADDKVITKEILEAEGISVPKKLLVIERIGNIQEQWKKMPQASCAIKPAKGRGGGGILVLDAHSDGSWTKGKETYDQGQIKRHIANIIFGVYGFGSDDVALIEEKIIPHACFTDIYPEGVADLRLIVKEGEMLMAMLRLPTKESDGRANLHQGAIGIGVDHEKGILTQGFLNGVYYDSHPDSKEKFVGREIPEWDKVVEITHKVFHAFPLDYLGVDIAFDQNKGPMVLEVNVRPGLEIQNVNRKGLKSIIKK